MIQNIRESDYTIASIITTVIHFACTYGAVCIGSFISCAIFNMQYDFNSTIIYWLVFNTIFYAYDMYHQNKSELKEHVKENGGIV